MHYILLSMLVGALFGGSMAIAQSSNAPSENKKHRYIAKFDEQFKAADKDGDGALTKTEAESAQMARIVDNFDRLDANRDGKVTRGEVRALVRGRLSS